MTGIAAAAATAAAAAAAGIYHYLPDVNAVLNTIAFVLICAGLFAIKRGDERKHKILMLSAVGVSTLILISYLIYHFEVGSVKFEKEGFIRWIYFPLLISHVVLAFVQTPLIVLTVVRGLRDQRERHRKIAKITAPIWLYVSITGVIVYVMLYRL